jgi:hypothetical protein
MGRSRQTRAAVAVAAALLLLTPLAASAAPALTAPPAVAAAETAPAQDPVTDDGKALRYQGGRVLLDPRVYVVFWGSEWGQSDAKGMPTSDPDGVAPVVVDFFSRLGGKGDAWSTILTQYCSGTKMDDKSCGPGSRRIPRMTKSPMRGWWVDTSPGPGQSNVDYQMGAWDGVTDRALKHFGATHPDDIVVLMLPPGNNSANCSAFHGSAGTAAGGPRAIIGIPYPLPACPNSKPPSCVLGQVECLPTAELAITQAASHEYAEVVTNPFPINCPNTTGICGWILKDAAVWADRGPRATEISDTCSYYRYVQLNGKKVSVAALWSNTANKGQGGCVARYISDKQQD